MAYKGRFRPTNPEKYKGNSSKVVYRSSWELKMMRIFDTNPNILEWSSEEIVIPYRSPMPSKTKTQNKAYKMRRYFPDFYVKKKTKNGKIVEELIEVKPLKQTMRPDPSKKNATPTGRISRRYLNEVTTFATNKAKWAAAEKFCEGKGWNFTIVTEKELGI